MKILYTISGIVQHAEKRGKRLGFPTMNIPLGSPIPDGVYVSQTIIREKTYNSLTFIGAAKTFDENIFQAESYVFDFHNDIYGEEVSILLLKKIRDNLKFTSEKELITQMENDKKDAEEYFKTKL